MKFTMPRVITAALALAVLFSAMIAAGGKYEVIPRLISRMHPMAKMDFPEVNISQLSTTQRKVVSLLKQEYAAQPKGAKYSIYFEADYL
jgi:hypothetical protein